MKRLALIVMAVASTSALAQGIRVEVGNPQALARCQNRLEQTRQELRLTSEELQSCREDRSGRSILLEENRVLRQQVSDLLADVDQLERENDSLKNHIFDLQRRIDDLTRPAPTPVFDLAESVRACSGINNSVYAKNCAAFAKQYRIEARTIEACTKISNTYYALECVGSAGKTGASAAQVKACSEIQNSTYAAQCVSVAGAGRVQAKVIRSCVETTSNTYYQLDCVKQMAN